MKYIVGLDIGTSGAKALVCDGDGRVCATAVAPYPLATPQPLWSEQDPEDWWRGACTALRVALAGSGVMPAEIVGLGLTGQMHGAVFLDERQRILRPALLWNDQRTAAECQEIAARVGAERLIALAGNPALTGFQAPKILWLRNHEPQFYARLAHVLLPKDYVRLRLTGACATDASDAAGTLLLDLQRRDWSRALLDALAISPAWLPRVYEGPQVTGTLLAHVAAEVGLPPGLPVVAGGGDNAAAAVGTGVVRAGVVSSSIGTSGVVFAHTDGLVRDPQGQLHSFCHAIPGQYHVMAVTLSSGGALRWFRDALRAALPAASDGEAVRAAITDAYLSAQAGEVPIGAEGLLFLPYLTGERTPHCDPLARGAFVGLTSRHGPAHMARAVMEGVIFALRDGLDVMRRLGVPIAQVRATGGGARSMLWRQMQADVYGVEVVTLAAEEGPAYGAALLAGVGAGLFADVDAAVTRCVTIADSLLPDPAAQERYAHVYTLYRSLYAALREHMHALARFDGAPRDDTAHV